MIIVFIALGSNLDDPLQQLISAGRAIHAVEDCQIDAWSNVYLSAPQGPADQPDYLNAVVRVKTGLDPFELLDALQAIENAQGRKREAHWGPRTIDLDIIFFENQVIHSDRLVVPHAQWKTRAFVTFPLSDIEPDLTLPCGETLQEIKSKLTGQKLDQQISSEDFAKACSHSSDSLQWAFK